MSLIDLNKRKEKPVFVSATKSAKHCTIGLTLNYFDGGKILIRHVFEDGIFADTDLKAGMILIKVNDKPVKGMSTIQAMELFTEAEGEISVEAEDVGMYIATVMKDSPGAKVGIGLKDRGEMCLISTIAEDGLFANTTVDIGQQLLSVNGTSCVGLTKNQAIILFKELDGLTVMTKDVGVIFAKVYKETATSKVGIGLRAIDKAIVVSSVADDSLFASTAIKPGLRLLQVNQTDMYGLTRQQAIAPFKDAVGPLTVLADDIGLIAARAFKETAESKVGIGLKEMSGHLIVSTVAEDSIFADTPLKPGLRLVCVGNVLTKGLSKIEAINLFKESQGYLTVLAERIGLIVSSAFKDAIDAKVGIGLKAVNGKLIISSIAEDSIFAATDLKVGHRLVSVNRISCLGMTKSEAIKLFKEAEGKVTVMSEEVGIVVAKATKESPDAWVGIGLMEANGGDILISCIYDSGLFSKTDLKEDLKIISVNDKKVEGMSRKEAIDLFRNAEGEITVLAEDPSEKSFIA